MLLLLLYLPCKFSIIVNINVKTNQAKHKKINCWEKLLIGYTEWSVEMPCFKISCALRSTAFAPADCNTLPPGTACVMESWLVCLDCNLMSSSRLLWAKQFFLGEAGNMPCMKPAKAGKIVLPEFLLPSPFLCVSNHPQTTSVQLALHHTCRTMFIMVFILERELVPKAAPISKYNSSSWGGCS